MQDLTIYIFAYLIFINLFSVLITLWDKYAAVHHRWRVRESTLLLCSALGGSPLMLLTMHLIRHKTQHKKFMIGIPVILAVQLAAAALWLYRFYAL